MSGTGLKQLLIYDSVSILKLDESALIGSDHEPLLDQAKRVHCLLALDDLEVDGDEIQQHLQLEESKPGS